MQKQVTPINKSTENKLIKIIVVSLLFIFFSLFIMVSLVIVAHSEIILPINLFLQTHLL